MGSPSLYRYDYHEEDEYQSADEATDTILESESEGYEFELESMTGKGINRLCSELLEIKKASNEDFQKNIFSNYSAFVRIFEEYGGIGNEIMKMKNHISTQQLLVEDLMKSFNSEIILDKLESMRDECVEDLDPNFSNWLETRMQNVLETLDVLMSERRMDEVLVLLEKETQNLHKFQKENDCLFPNISSFSCVISDLRTRLAAQFALLAGHMRVTWPELYNALCGLCRLGENDRASALLLNFFHLQVENGVNELKYLEPFPPGTCTLKLTKTVFSTIFQAAKGFAMLFRESSFYVLDLMRWAREELKLIKCSFDMYAKSLSETSFALSLAAEIMNISFSFCSLLEKEGFSLQSDMIILMNPSITEAIQMHFDQLKKVVSLFVSTDTCVLTKFSLSGKLSNNSPLVNINGRLECLQLTSSGIKFITLMQMVLDDTSPFQAFHFENLILKGLSDLFNEYTLNLERALIIKGHVEECASPSIISAKQLQKQISILVNSFVLVQLLPTIIQKSFNVLIVPIDEMLPEQDKLSSHKQLDFWKLAIQEAADRLRSFFCRLFVFDFTSHENSEFMEDREACSCGHCLQGSLESPMPTFFFQELFTRLRQLEKLFESILLVNDGMLLLNGIMMAVIYCLSENAGLFEKSHSQLLLDVHFLMEIARVGGYFSDSLMVAALNLIAAMKEELSAEEFQMQSVIPGEGWASNAAKLAVKTLLEVTTLTEPESKYTNMVQCINKGSEGNKAMNGFEETTVTVDGIFVHSLEDFTRSSQSLHDPITDEQGASENDFISDRLSRLASFVELDADDFAIIYDKESSRDSDLGAKLTGTKVQIQVNESASIALIIDAVASSQTESEVQHSTELLFSQESDQNSRTTTNEGEEKQDKHANKVVERFRPFNIKNRQDSANEALGKAQKGKKLTRPQWQ